MPTRGANAPSSFAFAGRVATLLAVLVLAAACEDDNGSDGATTTTTTEITTTTLVAPTTTFATTTVPPGGSTTTTSVGPSTTTTVCPLAFLPEQSSLGCAITFGVTNDVTLGALQFDVAYDSSKGRFEGDGDQVVCTDLSGSLASFNHLVCPPVLVAGLISLGGIDGPRDVIRCSIISRPGVTEPFETSDFTITVVDAADPDLNPVTAEVEVSQITCVPVGPSTTTTTTTLP